MPRFKKEYESHLMGEINVTSLVDVTMTLLIIFMISTPLFQGGIEVVLPKTQTAQCLMSGAPSMKRSGYQTKSG